MTTTPKAARLYRTERTLIRTLRVAYPSGRGRMVLRTEKDWDRNLEPVAVSEDGDVSTFELEADQPFLYFKPCLVESGATHWSVGPNKLVLMTEKDARVSYPYFFSPEAGRFSSLVELPSKLLGRDHKIRGYLPPGYDENTLSRFPVVYMQDGQNLFFPEEAFHGTGLEGRRDRRRPSRHERRRGRSHPGDLLGRSDDGVHEAGLRAVRPVAGRGGRAGDRAPRNPRGARTAGTARSGARPSAASSRSTRSGSTPTSSAAPSACRAPSPTGTISSTAYSRSRSGTSASTSTAAGPATTTRSPSEWPWR